MISVSREDLLNSKTALEAVGKTYMPVDKELYWFVKSMKKIANAMKREGKLANVESNQLVKEMGTMQPNQQLGIDRNNMEVMEKYSNAMQDFQDKEVVVDVERITLTQLKELQVTLQVADQMALSWLLQEV